MKINPKQRLKCKYYVPLSSEALAEEDFKIVPRYEETEKLYSMEQKSLPQLKIEPVKEIPKVLDIGFDFKY
jgi:hypothetical protein